MQLSLNLITTNLLSPPVLSFMFGLIAVRIRSDLKIPNAIYKIMTIYLLFAIGLKGGSTLSATPWTEWLIPCLCVLSISSLIPLIVYPISRFWLGFKTVDAASLCAHYGSVSAVTFAACQSYLSHLNVSYEGYITALLALMEIPAILIGLALAKILGSEDKVPIKGALQEILRGSSIFLLLAGFFVGMMSSGTQLQKIDPFFIQPFYGVLVLFLLELGLMAGQNLKNAKLLSYKLILFSILFPLIIGPIGLVAAKIIGMSQGGSVLVAVLCASASYIAAPAATRMALPKANPVYTLSSALGITFPFNLCVSIPLFYMLSTFIF